MVEDRITDGERVAELLASELAGLDHPPLDRIGVVDAVPDAAPSPDGTLAYRVAVDGDVVGDVHMFPERLAVHLSVAVPSDALEGRRETGNGGSGSGAGEESAAGGDPPALDVATGDDGTDVVIRCGAGVKRMRDLLATVAETHY